MQRLCPIYPVFPYSDFVFQKWGWFGGLFFLHFMIFPTFLEKIILGIKFFYYFRKSILDLFPTIFDILKSAPSLTG